MNGFILGIAGIAAIAAPAQAIACNGNYLGTYTTEISSRDTYSSSGARLTSVGAIIQQDRANMHRFGSADDADGYDDMFVSAESRAVIPGWIHDVPAPVSSAIRRGSAFVWVHVYEGCIDVSLEG